MLLNCVSINGTATDGFAQINVQFVFEKQVDQAMQDVRDALSAIRSQLPAEILEPILKRFDPNDLPIVSLTLTSTTLTAPQLTSLADPGITGDLRSVAGEADRCWCFSIAKFVEVRMYDFGVLDYWSYGFYVTYA
jgi:HAE1 family hydrophobic/amphiphilic exporter-1